MKKTLLFLLCVTLFSNVSFSQPFAAIQNIDPNAGNEPYEIASGDLDNDGFVDIVMATYDFNGGTPLVDVIKWYKNDGTGIFTLQTTVSSTILWVDGLEVADIDGQFGLDIVATSAQQNKLVYFLSDGAGGFGSEVVVDGTLGAPGQVFVGDINLDGNMDLATAVFTDNRTVWYAGDGTGNFTPGVDIENGTTDGPYYMSMDDFDGDGDLDAVVGYANSQSVEIFYNQYIESGTMTVSWIKDTVTVSSGYSFLFDVLFGDVNNDGNLDVVTLDNVSGDVEWFNKVKNGTSTANIISDDTIIDRPARVVVTDINNDTFNDVIVTDSGVVDEAIIFFEGADMAPPSATQTLIGDVNNQMFDLTVADFDGDLDQDIAVIGNSSDSVDWFENELITLSIPELTTERLNVFPNPTNNLLNFAGIPENGLLIEIYDVVGKSVMRDSISQNTALDVSALESGIYLITFENLSDTIKFIKQ